MKSCVCYSIREKILEVATFNAPEEITEGNLESLALLRPKLVQTPPQNLKNLCVFNSSNAIFQFVGIIRKIIELSFAYFPTKEMM